MKIKRLPFVCSLLLLFVAAVATVVALASLSPPLARSEPYGRPVLGEAAVAFPADYRERYVRYATVACPNSGIVREMYVNPGALAALKTSDTVPSGTKIVMETHAARRDRATGSLVPTRLGNVFVREKRDGWRVSAESGEWQSAWYGPQGSLVSSGQGSCISCHAMVRDRDYVFTLPALLAAARTGQLQQQETEFGTSVCR